MIKFKRIRNIVFTGLILISIYACNKEAFLETVSKKNLTDETMWASEGNADIYLNDCYSQLEQKTSSTDWMDCFTDDMDTPSGNVFTSYFWKSGICLASSEDNTQWGGLAGFNYDANWSGTYTKVRKLNTFMEKVAEKSANFSPEYVAKRTDEARFLRAYFYSELFMRIGGFAIVTKSQDRATMTEDELYLPRSTFQGSFDFIISELDAILNNGVLAVKYNNGDQNAGRATLGAALALKGWLQLFAASPAYNSSSTAVPQSEDNLQSFATPDPDRWVTAAATNKKFIDTWGHNGDGTYNFYPKMTACFYEANEYNEEIVWDRQQVNTSMPVRMMDFGGGPVYIFNNYYNWGNFDPTQELVDEFQMANGMDIWEEGSGYDDQNPYVGREKRFYDFILYDGASYKMDWMPAADTYYTRIDKVNPSPNEIDFSGADATKTGYAINKKCDNLHSPSDWRNNGQNDVYYRYTEVVLNYAEAQNEAAGPDASVYEAINAVRARPGTDLPPLIAGLSKDDMRKAIWRERRVELQFEEKRLYDLWRWKIAMDKLNTPLGRMKIYNSKPDDNSGVWIYERIPLDVPAVFTQKMYFNPIPQNVIDRNPKLKQNWGY